MSTTTGTDADAFASRAEERDAAPQFVLPLVVRIERDAPPTRTDALETAARAVLTLLTDERSVGEGEWAEAVRDWQDGRIRKVVRRARGAEWRRAEALPGITVHGQTAEVRVFPPVPSTPGRRIWRDSRSRAPIWTTPSRRRHRRMACLCCGSTRACR